MFFFFFTKIFSQAFCLVARLLYLRDKVPNGMDIYTVNLGAFISEKVKTLISLPRGAG